jgi:hypothetical protein
MFVDSVMCPLTIVDKILKVRYPDAGYLGGFQPAVKSFLKTKVILTHTVTILVSIYSYTHPRTPRDANDQYNKQQSPFILIIIHMYASPCPSFPYCKSRNLFVAYAAPTVLSAPINKQTAIAFGPSVP